MNHGDKVRYCEEKKFTSPKRGDIGKVISESLDGTCLFVKFETGDIWVLKDSVEVVE